MKKEEFVEILDGNGVPKSHHEKFWDDWNSYKIVSSCVGNAEETLLIFLKILSEKQIEKQCLTKNPW